MTRPVEEYQKGSKLRAQQARLAEKAKAGEYELIEPLDTKILSMLPLEGSLFGGLYPLGETANNLHLKFDKKVAISTISSRLRIMNMQGLCVRTRSVSEGRGAYVWQRTGAATKLLNERGKQDDRTSG